MVVEIRSTQISLTFSVITLSKGNLNSRISLRHLSLKFPFILPHLLPRLTHMHQHCRQLTPLLFPLLFPFEDLFLQVVYFIEGVVFYCGEGFVAGVSFADALG